MEEASDLQATGSNSTLRKTVGREESSWGRAIPERARLSRERAWTDGHGMETNSTDLCLMEIGLERQVLTICLEMQSLPDCFSTTWVMPTGLLRVEILSARIETGVGMTVSRAHWAD